MKLELITGKYGDVRTSYEKGEPWFVAKDLCNILELNSNNKKIIT